MTYNPFEQHVNSIDPDYCYHRKLQRRHVNTRIPGTVCGCPDCGVAYFIPDAIPNIKPVTVERVEHHYTGRPSIISAGELWCIVGIVLFFGFMIGYVAGAL